MSYVANKNNLGQLTNIHYWDSAAGAWSGNLIGAALPFAFLPNPVVAADLVIFGIDSTVLNAGPFCSLVFDLLTAQAGITAITWRYSSVAGVDPTTWNPLTVQDNTNAAGAMTGVAFDTTGINSVHWDQNALWIVQNPTIGGVALGVTGLWVCADMTTVPGAATPPVQQNRDIYTITWASAETTEVGGDMVALAEVAVVPIADAIAVPTLGFSRLLAGARLVSRGTDFTAYINLATTQNHASMSIAAVGGISAFVADITTATGQAISTAFPWGVTWNRIGTVQPNAPLERDYRGDFHIFLRAKQTNGTAGDITVRIDVVSTGAHQYTREATFLAASLGDYDLLDLGSVHLPNTGVGTTEDADLYFDIEARDTVGAGTLHVSDLILLPVDECAIEVWNDQGLLCDRDATGTYNLHMDSIQIPKLLIRAITRHSATNAILGDWNRTGQRMVLLTEGVQRIWFITAYTSLQNCKCENAHTVDVTSVQRYSSMRGDR